MTFKERYEEAKKAPRKFIKEVQEATKTSALPNGISEGTIRLWIGGVQKPNKFIVEKLEQHFNCQISELFPDYQEES